MAVIRAVWVKWKKLRVHFVLGIEWFMQSTFRIEEMEEEHC